MLKLKTKILADLWGEHRDEVIDYFINILAKKGFKLDTDSNVSTNKYHYTIKSLEQYTGRKQPSGRNYIVFVFRTNTIKDIALKLLENSDYKYHIMADKDLAVFTDCLY